MFLLFENIPSHIICVFVGEYISLYHHQRALLQQREIQKNEYIKQLAHDREELQVHGHNRTHTALVDIAIHTGIR